MKYLNQTDIETIGTDWKSIFDVLKKTTELLFKKEYSQPIKPYLRYKNLQNRIIAMPAYIGGTNEVAGIKWIASFPDNYLNGLPRAHSIIILNDANNGKPFSIINTSLISGIRTVGVSGMIINEYLTYLTTDKKIKVGIIGFGPIGKLHLEMLLNTFSSKIEEILLYDIKKIDDSIKVNSKIKIIDTWEEVYDNSTIFITCTVSNKRYIDRKPLSTSLHLNVSLRDYEPDFLKHVDVMIVDNWEEICRENTDIEAMHNKYNLSEKDAFTIDEIFTQNIFEHPHNKVIMFNPMGMATFDIAIGKFFFEQSNKLDLGINLIA